MISRSVEETERAAREFAGKIGPRALRAALVALSGDLGSGKTTFAKAFAGSFGVRESDVASPTFVIMKSYELDGRRHFKKLVHIDAYRLERPGEIERLGWRELLSDPESLVLLEWPENIGEALPDDVVKISFRFIDENTREIVFN